MTEDQSGEDGRIVVLVPFREDGRRDNSRQHQLDRFLNKMASNLSPSEVQFVVVEQSHDGYRFNKGQLLNAGFAIVSGSGTEYSNYIFHDLDMAPDAGLMPEYKRPLPDGGGLRLIEADWQRYGSDGCFGGVVIFSDASYRTCNGFPNQFWGWGGEDNAMFARTLHSKLEVERIPGGKFDDLEELTVDQKLAQLKLMDAKCKDKRKLMKEDQHEWQTNGVNSVKYELKSTVEFQRRGHTVLRHTVQLESRKPGHVACGVCAVDLQRDAYSH